MGKRTNYDSQMRKVDAIYSAKALRKMEDKILTHGRDKAMWKSFERQQQESLGFANIGGATNNPAAVTWLSQAWDNLAVYPAGNGTTPVAGSFVQLNGVVYAIPGTTPSTAGTPPPGGVFVVQNPGPGMNGWQVNPNPRASVFANPTVNFPAPPVFVDVPDAAWYPPDNQVVSTTASQSYFPAPGVGILISASATTFSTLQVSIGGSFTTAFTFTATTYIPVFLDGLSWKVVSSGTTRNTYTIYRTRMLTQF